MNRATILCLIGGMSVMLGMSGEGCRLTSALPVGDPLPPAIIPVNPTDATLQRTFTVDLGDYPQTESINWEFGDGAAATNMTVSTGRTVTHEYARGGTFTVKVHLFGGKDWVDGAGTSRLATGSLPVDVVAPNQVPTATFTVADVLDSVGAQVPLTKTFDATGSRDPDGTIVSYSWEFGDGELAVGKTLEHTYDVGGRYVVRLTAIDDRGGKGSVTKTVFVNMLPVPRFTATVDPGDAMRYTFDASASSDADGPIRQYSWDFADGTATETGQVVSHKYAVPDTYSVTLTVVDDVGAVISLSQDVHVAGTELFVRSITPAQGVVDTTVSDAVISGENFQSGAAVRLEQGSTTINGTSVAFDSASALRATFDLTGAPLGNYTLVVENPDTTNASHADAFLVVSANRVRLTTSMGDIVFELVDDAPITTANFLTYVNEEFYDGTIFHRVISGFVVQGGGFLPGMIEKTGVHDPIQNEFKHSNVRGTVAMAKVGGDPDSATSQFFVNLVDNSANLDTQNGGFTVFANVVEGMDVVDAIAAVPVDSDDQPLTDVLLTTARRE
jgi:cyclophilin family peptidyl-prolyl cis-trans isomerase/PKD repeat protein